MSGGMCALSDSSFASGSNDSTVKVWSRIIRKPSADTTASALYLASDLRQVSSGQITSMAVLSSGRLAVMDNAGKLRVWSLIGKKVTHTIHGFRHIVPTFSFPVFRLTSCFV